MQADRLGKGVFPRPAPVERFGVGDEGEVRQTDGKQFPGGDSGGGGGVVAHGKRSFGSLAWIGVEKDDGHCPEGRRVDRGRPRATFDHSAEGVPKFGEFGDKFRSWLPVHHLDMRAAAKGDFPHARELMRDTRHGLGLEVEDRVHGRNGG
jgi:hypothetical protein